MGTPTTPAPYIAEDTHSPLKRIVVFRPRLRCEVHELGAVVAHGPSIVGPEGAGEGRVVQQRFECARAHVDFEMGQVASTAPKHPLL